MVFGLYGAGLGLWLSIGLLPSLSSGIAGFRHFLVHLATSGGFGSGIAARIADRSSRNGCSLIIVGLVACRCVLRREGELYDDSAKYGLGDVALESGTPP